MSSVAAHHVRQMRMLAAGAHLRSRRGPECEPERVTVAGELAGTFGNAGDDVEDNGAAVAVLAHAGRGLGYGPDERPCPPPDVAAAVAGAVLCGDVQHAVVPDAAIEEP